MLFKLFPAFPAFLVCVVATSTLFAQERTWEDATGKYTVSGSLVQVTDGKVLLRTDDGATRLIPLNRLSQRDQAYVEAYVEDKASELPETFEAEVVNVITGDMLTISFHGNRHKIRLAGIDAPESGQAFFKQSKKHLRDLINRKTVSAVVVDRDGDTSCDLTVDSSRVDHDLLRNGFAWHDVNESSDGQRQQLEDEAKAAKRNLWSEPAAAPWQWKQWSGSERKQWVKDQEAQQLAISRRVVFGEATVSVWPARVIGISDGDTITVLNESNEQVKVRLAGIDTPEKRQPFGRKSRDAIGAILQDREVMILETGKDRYKRSLAFIELLATKYDERSIANAEMIRQGFAWHYKTYNTDPALSALEADAKMARRGLWADSQTPVAPWEWRKQQRAKGKADQ